MRCNAWELDERVFAELGGGRVAEGDVVQSSQLHPWSAAEEGRQGLFIGMLVPAGD